MGNTRLTIAIYLFTFFIGCQFHKSDKSNNNSFSQLKTQVLISKGAYNLGETLDIQITIKNKKKESVSIESVDLTLLNISSDTPSLIKSIPLNKFVGKWSSNKELSHNLSIDLSSQFDLGVYGVYLTQKEKDANNSSEEYQTFFRIIEESELTVFDIKTETHQGIPVFKLDGGMSAEYIVEKAAENLTSGISHSWEVNAPGSGPNHVLATPNFLEKSVNKTVEFYNETLGKNTEIETVLISTGFPSIPYISNALKAAVLPMHFLVSVNSVKEVQTILQTANDKGIESYATLAHDPSVPYAVSWVKLLELPEAYINFIQQHKVKNVVVLGATGTSGGETKAKELLYCKNINGLYANRSIYIMYPGTSKDDVKTLNEKIVDLKEFKQQDDFIRIVDWESGINQKQLINYTKNIKDLNADIAITTITAESLGRLYALGGYSTLALMHKNITHFNGVKGIVFNPYLISHATIELKKGFVPLLYWQLVGAHYTVNAFENDLYKAIKHFYPKTNAKKLKLWLNSTRNFGAEWSANNLRKELIKKGYTNFIENNYQVDEVWDLLDGVDAPSELLYKEIKNSYGFENLKQWNNSLTPLTISDIEELSKIFGGFEVEKG